MSKISLLLAPYLVAFALLLAVPFCLKTTSTLASDDTFLAVEGDLQMTAIFEPESKPKQPHFMWQKEPKIALVIEIKPQKPIAKPQAAVLGATSTDPTIVGLVNKYAQMYGAHAQKMLVIAKCESGFNPNAVSPSGTYVGMYQFNASTWGSNRRAMGLDESASLRANAEEAIKTAAFKMGRDGYGAWPVCGLR